MHREKNFQNFIYDILHLASERLLATGDNSALESFASKCKLYMYETLEHKKLFLAQQLKIAKEISPSLEEFVRLFSTECPLSKSGESQDRIYELLNHPELSKATLQMCKKISYEKRFEKTLEAGLKRLMWMNALPELEEIEVEAINKEWKMNMINHVKADLENAVPFEEIPEVIDKEKIAEKMHQYNQKFSSDKS